MSFTFNISVADMTFQISSVYYYVVKCCQQYSIDTQGEHKISLSQEDIDKERQIFLEEMLDEGISNYDPPDPYLESIALLRKLANHICKYNRILMHGSAIAINGKGYIFTALSGTGKSTHTALLRKLHGENAVMINDDKPFLHIKDGKVYVCGTPWMGKHELGSNIIVPLEGIFFLRRSENNVLNKYTPDEALTLLMSQCHRPSDAFEMMETLSMMDQILSIVPLYDFGCNQDISAAELSSSVMV